MNGTHTVGTVRSGETYRCLVPGFAGWLYRVVDFVTHGVTLQSQVLYTAVNGPDERRLFVTSLNDFVLKFEPLPADAPPPEKLAGALEPVPPGSHA